MVFIAGEHIVNLIASDVEEASGVRSQCFAKRSRVLVGERPDRLVRFRRECSEVDECSYVWITGGCASDHNATVRMANHYHRSLLRVDEAFGGSDVVSE